MHDSLATSSQHCALTYVGHATVLIELDGVRILTDPLLRNRVTFLRRRRPLGEHAAPRAVDAVLISHCHLDHLDLRSLRRLDRGVRLIVPRGAGRYLARGGMRNIEELQAGDTTTVGGVTIRATYAQHDGALPFGPRADCLGFVVGGRRQVYFAGDTDLFPAMAQLAGHLDVALLPVWGWGPTLGADHLDPRRAAQALALLRPRLAIPIHWGTLHPVFMGWCNPRFLTEPARAFIRYAAELAPQVLTRILQPSTRLALDALLDSLPAGFSEERLPDGSQQAVGRRLRKYVEFGIRPVRRRKHHRFY